MQRGGWKAEILKSPLFLKQKARSRDPATMVEEGSRKGQGKVNEGPGRMLAITISIGFDKSFADILWNLCRGGRKA